MIKITNENIKNKINKLTDAQLKNLHDYIEYHFSVDSVDADVLEAKKQIYTIYKQDIAPLVNKIEVYEHRFPIDAYAGIETIFRCMSSIEETSKKDALVLYENVKDYAKNLNTQLSIQLINIYVKHVKQYKKTLTKFNYTGVYPCFKKEINLELKNIKEKLKLGLKLYKKRYTRKNSDIDYSYKIGADVQSEQLALDEALQKAEKLLTC